MHNGALIFLPIRNHIDRELAGLRSISGLVKVRNLIDLIAYEELDANPRHSKVSTITKDILRTLTTNPEMMPHYSKGLLLACSDVTTSKSGNTEDGDFLLEFKTSEREGILDGGHNTLAIGIALLKEAGVDDKEISKIKVWRDLKDCWSSYGDELRALQSAPEHPTLDALIPIEIVTLPYEEASPERRSQFNTEVTSICANRNQNAQLSAEAVANKSGALDALKQCLPPNIVRNVTWKTNEGGHIDPRFVVALSWVTLAKAPTVTAAGVTPLPGTSAYSARAEALRRFVDVMEAECVSVKDPDTNTLQVTDSYVRSALEMLPEVLRCFDIITMGFRDAYNANNGSFGHINAVKKATKKENRTMFSQEVIDHEVPPLGFLMPVVFSMQALVEVNYQTQTLQWIKDPVVFYSNPDNLTAVVGALKDLMQVVNWDPQRVGKSQATYTSGYEKVDNLILRAMWQHP